MSLNLVACVNAIGVKNHHGRGIGIAPPFTLHNILKNFRGLEEKSQQEGSPEFSMPPPPVHIGLVPCPSRTIG
jgi:hypothetical protein